MRLIEGRIVEIDEIVVPDNMYIAWKNNDYTGLNDDEIKEMEDFFNKYSGCTFEEDEERRGFRHRNDVNNVGGECVVLRVFGELEHPIDEAIETDYTRNVNVIFSSLTDMLDFYQFVKEEDSRVEVKAISRAKKSISIEAPNSFINDVKLDFDCQVEDI
ncbi:MAG: hypothetical protein MJZ34_11360 [Paludibacteraceae bacterium]|nr:hypothetical protein [Paludibacteraceae bacterium]